MDQGKTGKLASYFYWPDRFAHQSGRFDCVLYIKSSLRCELCAKILEEDK